MRNHPQARAAGGAGGGAVLVVWLLQFAGLEVDGYVGAAIAGAITTAAFFIGRNGLRGIGRMLWRGQG